MKKLLFAAPVLLLLPSFAAWSQQGQPLAEYGTPDQHEVRLVLYRNGVPSEEAKTLFSRASSPEALVLKKQAGTFVKGSVLLTFVDFSAWDGSPHSEYLALASSADGVQFGSKQRIEISPNEIGRRATDPSLVQLEDGRIRIYFMTPGPDRNSRHLRSAIGSDGIHYQVEPEMDFIGRENSEVFRNGNRWFMLVSDFENHRSEIETSTDGIHWTRTSSTFPGAGVGALELRVPGDGQVIFTEQGVLRAFDWNPTTFSATPSRRFREFGIPGTITADPSPVELQDGTVAVYFKAQKMGPRR